MQGAKHPFAALFRLFGVPVPSYEEKRHELEGVPHTCEPERQTGDFLVISLSRLPDLFERRGIYGKAGDWMPPRALLAQKGMAAQLIRREEDHPGVFHFSDLFRTAASSLRAIQSKRGAKPPAYSGHNFGDAVDDDLSGNRSRLRDSGVVEMGKAGWKDVYDEINRGYHLFCFRKDGKNKFEAWHFAWDVETFDNDTYRTREHANEEWINHHYGDWWRNQMTTEMVQKALKKLDHDPGPIDGIFGDRTRAALTTFQRKWKLSKLGRLTMQTRRVLAYVSAEIRVV